MSDAASEHWYSLVMGELLSIGCVQDGKKSAALNPNSIVLYLNILRHCDHKTYEFFHERQTMAGWINNTDRKSVDGPLRQLRKLGLVVPSSTKGPGNCKVYRVRHVWRRDSMGPLKIRNIPWSKQAENYDNRNRSLPADSP